MRPYPMRRNGTTISAVSYSYVWIVLRVTLGLWLITSDALKPCERCAIATTIVYIQSNQCGLRADSLSPHNA
jgi:hypothetical protein